MLPPRRSRVIAQAVPALLLLLAVLPLRSARATIASPAAEGVVSLGLRDELGAPTVTSHAGFHRDMARPPAPLEITSSRDISGAVRAIGGSVEAYVAGRVTAARVPLGAMDRLAAVPGVQTLFPARRLRPLLDTSIPEVRVPQVWAQSDAHGLPVKGSHVLVGILDSGIDIHNPDFRNPDGTTRIRYLWDQTAHTGRIPAGFAFGAECTAATIDAGACSERDTDGHGTFVAGIAAGNGRSSPAGAEMGVAPQADLVVVKSDYSADHIIAAWRYMIARAAALHEPIVINNSFGGMQSPHDGSAPDSLAADRLSGPGRLFVAAAGNEANRSMHADGLLPAGATRHVGFQAPAASSDVAISLFYPAKDSVDVTLRNLTTGDTSGPVRVGGRLDRHSKDGSEQVTIDSGAWNKRYREIDVEVSSDDSVQGQYDLELSGRTVAGTARWDGWIQDDDSAYFDTADNSDTINDPADARSVVAVGNYATSVTWTGLDGQQHSVCDYSDWCKNGTLAVGDIKPTSSTGPLLDGRQKPDISAPGTMVVGPLSADARRCSGSTGAEDCVDPAFVTPDGQDSIDSGTSMSAPYVAGALALMLQLDPRLDPTTALALLRGSARHDSFTGAGWTPTFGAGKLDIEAAVAALRGLRPVQLVFLAARAERPGSTPDRTLTSRPLDPATAGKPISLSAYLRVGALQTGAPFMVDWQVARGSTVVAHHVTTAASPAPGIAGRVQWIFTPRRAATYKVTITVRAGASVARQGFSFRARGR